MKIVSGRNGTTGVLSALDSIEGAELPDGSKPVLTRATEGVEHSDVNTVVRYGALPPGSGNQTGGVYVGGKLAYVQIDISDISVLPGSTYSDGSPKTLETVLAHEMGHAYRIINAQANLGLLGEELTVSGLENQYRFAQGIQQRQYYGTYELKQYP